MPLRYPSQFILVVLILLFSLGSFPAICFAASGCAENDHCRRTLKIHSEYTSAGAATTQHWRFAIDGNEVAVYLDGETAPRLNLVYNAEQRLIAIHSDVDILTVGSPCTANGQNVVLSYGYPVPFDDIHGADIAAGAIVYAKREIAGVKFSRSLTARVTTISVERARSAGYLADALQIDPAAVLRMVAMYADDGSCVVRQLWSDAFGCWLYEDNGTDAGADAARRSWLEGIDVGTSEMEVVR